MQAPALVKEGVVERARHIDGLLLHGYKLLALTLISGACDQVDCPETTPKPDCRRVLRRDSCMACRIRALSWLEQEAGELAELCDLTDRAWFGRLDRARDAVIATAQRRYGDVGKDLVPVLLALPLPMVEVALRMQSRGYLWQEVRPVLEDANIHTRVVDGQTWYTLEASRAAKWRKRV